MEKEKACKKMLSTSCAHTYGKTDYHDTCESQVKVMVGHSCILQTAGDHQ